MAQLDVQMGRFASGLRNCPRWTCLPHLPVDAALDDDSGRFLATCCRNSWCADLVAPIRQTPACRQVSLAEDAVADPVHAVSQDRRYANWKVPYHQDLSVPNRSCASNDPEPFGMVDEARRPVYVQAPEPLLSELLAVRLHLDACGEGRRPAARRPGFASLGTPAFRQRSLRCRNRPVERTLRRVTAATCG